MANRTPKSQWAALFNFAGGGLLHMELFLPQGGGVAGQTLLEWIASQLLLRGTHAARPNAALVAIGAEYYETDTANRFKSDGATWLADGQSGGGSPILLSTRTILSHAQILALPSTIVQIIPAPGAGKRIFLLGVCITKPIAWVAYDPVTDQAFLACGPSPNDAEGAYESAVMMRDDASGHNELGNLLGNPDLVYQAPPLWITNKQYYGQFAGQYIRWDNSAQYIGVQANGGDFTGGDAANEIYVTAYYTIVTL